MSHFFTAVRAAAQGQRDETVSAIDRVVTGATGIHDPEGLFYLTRLSAHVGDVEGALALFERVVADGFYCFPSFARDPWLDGLRAHPEFKRVLGPCGVTTSRGGGCLSRCSRRAGAGRQSSLDRRSHSYAAGRIFWFTRKKFVESYFFLMVAKRS